MDRNYSSVGLVVDEGPQEKIQYCSTCMAVGELNRLKQRIYLDDKGKSLPPPPDAEDWLQCWTCGLTVPVREVKKQGTISGITGIEVSSNPFDNKTTILGNDSKNRYKRLKQRKNKHPDAEIQAYLDKGYELKSYETYTPEPVNQ